MLAEDYLPAVRTLAKALCAGGLASRADAVAVIDFTDPAGGSSELGRILAEELSVELLIECSSFSIIDRSNLSTLFEEHQIAGAGLVDPETVRQLGRFIGADALVLGTVIPLGGVVRVSVKVPSVETAELLGAARADIRRTDEVDDLLNSKVEKGASARSDSSMRRSATSSVRSIRQEGFLFVLRSCVRGMQTVTCRVTVKNEGEKRFLELTGRSRLVGGSGRRYLPARLRIDELDTNIYIPLPLLVDYTRLGRRLPTGTSASIVVVFDGVSESEDLVPWLHLSFLTANPMAVFKYRFDIEFSDILLPEGPKGPTAVH